MKYNVTKDEIQQHFHLPLEEAAKALGICASVLKRSCRQHGIKRWPYRKVSFPMLCVGIFLYVLFVYGTGLYFAGHANLSRNRLIGKNVRSPSLRGPIFAPLLTDIWNRLTQPLTPFTILQWIFWPDFHIQPSNSDSLFRDLYQ